MCDMSFNKANKQTNQQINTNIYANLINIKRYMIRFIFNSHFEYCIKKYIEIYVKCHINIM